MLEIDVVVLTKNSYPQIRDMINSLLASDIPVNRIIFVDGRSTDGTLEYIKSLDMDKILVFDRGSRASAREIGIKNVETEWFMFLDSDIILPRRWFIYTLKYLEKSNVGAIWGTAVNIAKYDYNRYLALKKVYRKPIFEIARQQGERRGYTHDTLIRTEVVRDLKIPASLHTFEDHYIRRHIEYKGYIWISTYPPYCLHRHNYKPSDRRDWLLTGYYGKKLQFYGARDIIRYLTGGLFKAILISILSKDLSSGYIQYLNYLYICVGYLK